MILNLRALGTAAPIKRGGDPVGEAETNTNNWRPRVLVAESGRIIESGAHLLNNEPNNEAPVHCKRLIVNNEGKWAHCCNNEPPGLTMRLIVATMSLIVGESPRVVIIS